MLAAVLVCGHPVQPRRQGGTCISIAVAEIANVVNNEWCNENCADNPDSELCEDKCHCPVVAINRPAAAAQQSLGACVSNDPAIGAEWCEQNCATRTDTEVCVDTCDCPCAEGDSKCKQGKAMRGRKDPPPPQPRILGGWTNCGPGTLKLKTRAVAGRKAGSGNCENDGELLMKAMAPGMDADASSPSYAHEWGATAILPGRFGGSQVAPILGKARDYHYNWLTFGGEDTDSSNWMETAEQDIIDAKATGAAFDIEGGVTKEDMTEWILKMRKKHPHWTFVHVPKSGTEYFDDGSHGDDFVGYDPDGGGPDFVAPMLYYSNFNSYPQMDISNVATQAQSEALSALKRLQDAGWPSSRTILTYQSFDAARLRSNEGNGGLLPFLGKLLGNFSVEVRNYGDTFSLQGPYAGVLGWPAQCAYDDRRCWPAADKANLMEVIRGALESNLPHEDIPKRAVEAAESLAKEVEDAASDALAAGAPIGGYTDPAEAAAAAAAAVAADIAAAASAIGDLPAPGALIPAVAEPPVALEPAVAEPVASPAMAEAAAAAQAAAAAVPVSDPVAEAAAASAAAVAGMEAAAAEIEAAPVIDPVADAAAASAAAVAAGEAAAAENAAAAAAVVPAAGEALPAVPPAVIAPVAVPAAPVVQQQVAPAAAVAPAVPGAPEGWPNYAVPGAPALPEGNAVPIGTTPVEPVVAEEAAAPEKAVSQGKSEKTAVHEGKSEKTEKAKSGEKAKAEKPMGKSEKSKMFKCKVYGDCPKGLTDEPTEKYPEHSAEYMCKVYGQCDSKGSAP